MSELQPDIDDAVIDEPIESNEDVTEGQDDSGSESAPDTTGEAPAVKFTEEQQRIFDKAVGKKVFERRQAEREAEELRKRLAQYESEQSTKTKPVIPELPNPYALTEHEYLERLAKRDDALRQAAAYDAQQQAKTAQAEAERQKQQQAQHEALMQDMQTYSTRAVTLGIKPEELQAAGNTVAQFGMDESLVQMILHDDQGPLITKYLSQNLLELETISGLSPVQAALRIAQVIKPKAAALKPKVNSAPDPIEQPYSAGSTPRKSGPKGATFE